MMIYVIAWSEHGPVKIGWAERPEKRAQELQCACPYKLALFFQAACEGYHCEVERYVHNCLSSKRMVGEWFNCGLNDAVNAIRVALAARVDSFHELKTADLLCLMGGGAADMADNLNLVGGNIRQFVENWHAARFAALNPAPKARPAHSSQATPSDVTADMVKRWSAGEPVRAIAASHGCARMTVYRVLARAGHVVTQRAQ